MDKPTPFTLIKPRTLGAYMFAEKFFEIASGRKKLRKTCGTSTTGKCCFIMKATLYDIIVFPGAAAVDLHNGKSILLVEKGKAPTIVKKN